MNRPLVSVIVLNWNGKRFLEDCLISLEKQSYSNFEVIFVDNGSTDSSVDFIKEKFSWVKLIENKENLGFAAGNNKGIKISSGKYIVTLNNDTKTDRKWLESLINVAESSNNIGMCASKVLLLERPNVIDSVGINIYPDGMSKQRGYLEIDTGQYDKIEEVLLPSACAALYRKEMLAQIGLFDESFFAYCEDTDLGLRGRLKGWKAILVPSAIVYHLYSGTGGRYTGFKAFLVERNHIWVILKNFPLNLIIKAPFYTMYRYLLHVYGLLSKKGSGARFVDRVSKLQLLTILLKANFDALRVLPVIFRKRRLIQKSRKISGRGISALFRKYGMRGTELVLKD